LGQAHNFKLRGHCLPLQPCFSEATGVDFLFIFPANYPAKIPEETGSSNASLAKADSSLPPLWANER
jgi:hypothetical protein